MASGSAPLSFFLPSLTDWQTSGAHTHTQKMTPNTSISLSLACSPTQPKRVNNWPTEKGIQFGGSNLQPLLNPPYPSSIMQNSTLESTHLQNHVFLCSSSITIN